MTGQKILHYKILEKLGEGGMGVVFKAEDIKLKRLVALKFLPTTALQGKTDKERFIREAQATAALNHPNITHIYAIEEHDDQLFIVMELIEGKSLEEIIAVNGGSPLKIDKAIDYATQISAGLQAAHEKGIVHRDIKSANIMVNNKGVLKIMDFGLAKLANHSKMTIQGATLGTASYMSPEQAMGLEPDKRADIWALGVVLYEMISGGLPFKGEYEQVVIFQILYEQPEPLTALRSGLPIALDGIIAKALAKDPEIRYQNVDELPADLRAINTQTIKKSRLSLKTMSKLTRRGAVKKNSVLKWLTAFMTGVFFAGMAAWFIFHPVSNPVERWNISLPDEAPIAPIGKAPGAIGRPALSISPDGSKIVYVADIEGTTQLYLRSLEQFEVTPIPGTLNGYSPFFSPDGQWVGFFVDNQLKKTSLSGGVPVTLCSAPFGFGASWGNDGRIVFSSNNGAKLQWIPDTGGTAHLVTDNPGPYYWPELLPDGKTVIVNNLSELFTVSLESGKKKSLGIEGTDARYIANGYLVYNKDGQLQTVVFDTDSLIVSGNSAAALSGVRIESFGAAQCAISGNQTLVYLPGEFEQKSRLVWRDNFGNITNLPYPAEIYGIFQLSPYGDRIAIEIVEGDKKNIWIYNLSDNSRLRLTERGNNSNPVWSADGKAIAFQSDRTGRSAIFIKSADSKEEAKLVKEIESGLSYYPTSWSADGKTLALDDLFGDIWSLKTDDADTLFKLLSGPSSDRGARFSPDGLWIAYTSDKQGQYNVFVQPCPPTGETIQVSTEGGEAPLWSEKSNELFYRNGRKWMTASYRISPALSFGIPKELFEGSYLNIEGARYDVSNNNRRFLLLKPIADSAYTELNVVTNWFKELKHKLGSS